MPRTRIRSLARYGAVALMDATVIAATAALALKLRLQGSIPDFMARGLRENILLMVVVAILSFQSAGLYRRAWRYVSIPDLVFLLQVVTIAEIAMVATLVVTGRAGWLPASVPLIHWSMALIGLAMVRVARRSFRDYRRAGCARQGDSPAARDHSRFSPRVILARHKAASGRRALLIGETDWAELLLKQIERYHSGEFTAVGLIDPVGQETYLNIRGVPLLGSLEGFEAIVDRLASQQRRPQCVIVNSSDPALVGPLMVNLVARAERLGLEIARAPHLGTADGQRADGSLNLEFLNFSDLLDRPERNLNPAIVREAIRGQRVMVTGAGGSIGSELARQIASFTPSELILLDAGEYNLYAIDLEMRENFPELTIVPILCSVRQREHVMAVFDEHRPELVFHAAALKHVPLVEQNPCSGIQTNVIGTRIIADAARRVGARAMIQVSTDKAVNPIGMMGASKRLGELYCQALDLAGAGRADATRFVTVRFGNVLGSSGSLIPLFMRQLSHHGPLTVTHPEMERFFMTIHEAVHLILHSSAQALSCGATRGRIFVLDMGEPVKIVDIARRMIRLAGFEPDRDIAISFVGLRPGEKLFEELFDSCEVRQSSSLDGVFEACPDPLPLSLLQGIFDTIEHAAGIGDAARVRELVHMLLQSSGTETAPALPLFAQFDRATIREVPQPVMVAAAKAWPVPDISQRVA